MVRDTLKIPSINTSFKGKSGGNHLSLPWKYV
jgi:hypothetical protein